MSGAQISIFDLALDLGVDRSGLARTLARRVHITRRRKRKTKLHVFKADVAPLLARYGNEAEHGHWLSSAEAGRLLGITANAFLHRLRRGTIQVASVRLPGGYNDTRYSPDDVARLALEQGVRAQSIPGNRLSVSQLSELLVISEPQVYQWAERGCPHGRTVSGQLYFNPSEVALWLEGLRKGKNYGRRLEMIQVLRDKGVGKHG